MVSVIDEQWQADLADMSDVRAQNDGYRYLLVVIDCFSKYAWALPQRTKDAKATAVTFEAILAQAEPRQPINLQTDKGKEFCNGVFKGMLERHKIHHFTTHNEEIKAAIVERLNRTLKARLYRYFTHAHSERYLEVLPAILTSYNGAYHRSIGMAPKEVTQANEPVVYNNLYGSRPPYHTNTVVGGDAKILKPRPIVPSEATVRMAHPHKAFSTGYEPTWTQELFKVAGSHSQADAPLYKPKQGSRQRPPHHLYNLVDMAGEDIKGSFYPQEIQPVDSVQAGKQYEIQKIIRRRGKGANQEVLVKWKGLHRKYNEWILASSIQDQDQ
jgi:hypothetical protein